MPLLSIFDKTNGLLPGITLKLLFRGGGIGTLLNEIFWPAPPGGKAGGGGGAPFSIKSSIVGNERGGPRLKLFKFVPPPGLILVLLLLLSLKLVLPIPLSLSSLFCISNSFPG